MAIHRNKHGQEVDLKAIDDDYLLNIIRWANRRIRLKVQIACRIRAAARRRSRRAFASEIGDLARLEAEKAILRLSFGDAIEEARSRGILPTLADLEIARDLAVLLGHLDAKTGKPRPGRHLEDCGPHDLVELWVGYRGRDGTGKNLGVLQ